MKKNIKYYFLTTIFVITLLFSNLVIVKAYNLPSDVKTSFESFINYLNTGDEEIYNLIDDTNTELKENIDEYLHAISINYQIKDVTLVNNNHYKIEAVISASGIGWNVSGFSTYYELKLIDGKYKITDTSLFDIIGSENVMKFVLKIFAIIGGLMLSGVLIIGVIVFIVIKKNKKQVQNTNSFNNTL